MIPVRHSQGTTTHLLPVPFHNFISEIRVHLNDVIRRAFCEGGRRLTFRVLDVFLNECDSENLLRFLLGRLCLASCISPSDGLRDADVEQWIEPLERARVRRRLEILS